MKFKVLTIYALLFFSSLAARAQSSVLGKCYYAGGAVWVPIATAVNGAGQTNAPASFALYGKNSTTYYPLLCDANGNISAGAILGASIPTLATGYLHYDSGTGLLTWAAAGGISGSLTSGKMPVATGAKALADGPIDVGVTTPDTVTINAPGAGGLVLNASVGAASIGIFNSGTGGTTINDTGGGSVQIESGSDLDLMGAGSILMENTGPGGTFIFDNAGGGIQILDTGIATVSPGVTITSLNKITLGPLVAPFVVYSAAGTPLPAATAIAPGTEATVSDAVLPTYMGAYMSGGAVVCKVISDGVTGWFTH
jgi:hypothetical protein